MQCVEIQENDMQCIQENNYSASNFVQILVQRNNAMEILVMTDWPSVQGTKHERAVNWC